MTAESYIRKLGPKQLNPTDLLDLVYNEVLLREEDGESPRLGEYLDRFPGHAEALRAQFEVHEALRTSRPITLTLSTVDKGSSQRLTGQTIDESAASPPQSTARPEDGYRSDPLIGVATETPKVAADRVAGTPDPSWPRVEGYDILGVLGSGGMGTVYRAFDRKSGRLVALKTMNRAGVVALLRFKHEFRTLLDVVHPNLISLYELICDGLNWFLTMELLDGVDFLRHVRTDVATGSVGQRSRIDAVDTVGGASTEVISAWGGRPHKRSQDTAIASEVTPAERTPASSRFSRLRGALLQLAEGIESLHEAGKLHRDIKPSNVIVTHHGRVVLLDFGLAAEQDQDGQHRSTEEHLVGTAAYMAPEQASSRPVSPASDWYSVGVMLFEALTGRLPFQGGTLAVLMNKQQHDPPEPVSLVSDVPEDLNALCVQLLKRRPEERPSGPEILRRLRGLGATDDRGLDSPAVQRFASPSMSGQRTMLIGRQHHRHSLQSALADMRQGRPVVVYLHGSSGAGKTILLQSFLDEQIERGDAVVLAGRCYERESVPYKAFDSLIDSLGHYLGRLPRAEVAALLPRDVGSLARVFPSLRRVEPVAQAQHRGLEAPDPQELRRRAFSALRELLARMGDWKPLILAIDDLQWGDADSAALLVELLRPPDAPVLLFLATYRSEDRVNSPLLQALSKAQVLGGTPREDHGASRGLGVDCRELGLEPLAHDEAHALALALLGEYGLAESASRQSLLDAIVHESRGNPFFVAELVRHVQGDKMPVGWELSLTEWATLDRASGSRKLALDEVLWSRIRQLPAEARRLLELIAVSGGPLRLVELNRCLEQAQDERTSLALLRAGRLIRSTGRAESDEVETYHDRVRETIVAHLQPEVLRAHHHRLALVLEATGQADPEVLGVHFLGALQTERAVDYFAQAADRAALALAFERAASLYRCALELGTGKPGFDRTLSARLGDALANAGRGAEAARAYLAAVPGATVAEALELQRRSAMQYLISGHIDEGLATLRTVLATVRMALPGTPRRSLLSLLWQRGRLRLRGLGFQERDPSEIADAVLTRIDVCWSAAVGLSVVDTVRGADFQARGLLLSLNAGERSRIARALAMEAAHAASTGGSNRKSTERLLEMADSLARRVEHPYAQAIVTLARGVSAYLEGRWRTAQEECDRAEVVFGDHCTGVAWERHTANAFSLWGLSHQGEVAELSRRWPILRAQALERGDLYAAMNLSSYLMSIVRLAGDDPSTARAELRETMSKWSYQGYHVQHNDALWAGVQIELYCGAGVSAWDLISRSWPALRRSLLLRVQFIRTSMYFLRARAAMAAALELRISRPAEALSLLARTERYARLLERERMPCPAAYARLIQGALAGVRGDPAQSDRLLREAVVRFEAVDMRLCSSAARRRRGELIGGETGRTEIGRADEWMAGQKIRDPERMAAMILPRFCRERMGET